ncbi:efflux transporter periplasmic adaptor subunit [Deltaproteobacteria bacterium Smac51]|nr:efflux transporter periplasmic adaptor subunit [Deltaproteobacteria bacterium Smac51]
MSVRKIFGKLSLLFFLLPALTGCGQAGAGQTESEAAPMPEVTVMLAQPIERAVIDSYPGRLAPFRQAEVRARVAGILMERLYIEGQDVTEGQTLFSIDDAQLKLDVLTAKSELARAQAELYKSEDTLRRHEVLLDKKAIQEHDYVASLTAEMQAKAAVDNATAALGRAELRLSYARVTAPISGRAGLSLVSEGALVGQDEPTRMTTIEQVDPIYADFSQPSADLLIIDDGVSNGRLKKIDEADIEVFLGLPDGSRYPHAGRLIFTNASVDPKTDNVSMRAVFPNPERLLRPGTYLNVSLSRAINPCVFLVPRDSLLRNEEASHVLVVSDQNLVEKRPVKADELDGKNWVVTAGLEAGERVILNSLQAAAFEGQEVSVASIVSAGEKLALNN